jgi:hypothetical protein
MLKYQPVFSTWFKKAEKKPSRIYREKFAQLARNHREKCPYAIIINNNIKNLTTDKNLSPTSAKFSRRKWEISGKLAGNFSPKYL